MKIRMSIFAKITAIFLANVAVLGLGLAWVLHQGWGLMALPATRSDKLERVGGEILRAMGTMDGEKWDDFLAAASAEHGVTFFLQSTDGPRLAGPPDFLPGNVHGEVTGGGGSRRRRPPPPPPGEGRGPDNDSEARERSGPPRGEPPPAQPLVPPPHDPALRPILTASSGYWCYLMGEMRHPRRTGNVALITKSDSPSGHGFYANMRGVWWLIATVLLVSALVWLPFVRSLTRRLRTMQNTAGRLAQGDFTARAEDKRSDELSALGHSVNHMADQIGTLVDGQKRLLGDIAHELSSPIARMQAMVGILESPGGGDSTRQAYIDRLDGELQQMGQLVQELLSLSKANLRRSIELRPIPLRQQVESVISRERRNGERVEVDIPGDLTVLGDPELLARAVGNVLRNAIRYGGTGLIKITARREDDETASLTISDEGPGVPPESLPRLFDAFYRPDTSRCRETGGSGLGLAIVKSCVEATGGQVSARNLPQEGFEVTMRFQGG